MFILGGIAMAFCTVCGEKYPDEAPACPACGAANTNQATVNVTEPAADEKAEAESGKILSILSYIGILVIIPLITGDWKKNSFVKFHANQGLVLAICFVVGSILQAVPVVGWIIGSVIYIAYLVFAILGIVAALKGEKKVLPLFDKLNLNLLK
jgi:uncharacterized membrane protein